MDIKSVRSVCGLVPLLALFASSSACALSVTNFSVADTSLIEVAPENNNGGQGWVLAGRTQNGPHVRGLYRFDLTNIPPHAIIQSAVLQLDVTGQPTDMEAVNSIFSLHRVLQPWGEGTNNATSNPGQGTPATPGGATWLHRFYPTDTWAAPGGAPGTDYASEGSSFQRIEDPDHSPYRFDSTPELVADVQAWVSQPEDNHGWMLIGDEDLIFTARRFNSREDTNAKPALEISFILPAHIDAVQKLGNQFNLSFVALPGQSYTIEFRESFATGEWKTLTDAGHFTETNRVIVVDTVTATQSFYRVGTR